jgi:hypothetical protein
MPISEDRLDGFNAQRGADAINDGIENLIQVTPPMEKEILAVLRLIDRIIIMKAAALLFFDGQGEAQASWVYPTPADLDQAPYSERVAHGICESIQAWSVVYMGKTVSLFGKGNIGFSGLNGDIVMTAQDDLGVKRGMRTEFDHQMSPLGAKDVERVMVDPRRPVALTWSHFNRRTSSILRMDNLLFVMATSSSTFWGRVPVAGCIIRRDYCSDKLYGRWTDSAAIRKRESRGQQNPGFYVFFAKLGIFYPWGVKGRGDDGRDRDLDEFDVLAWLFLNESEITNSLPAQVPYDHRTAF